MDLKLCKIYSISDYGNEDMLIGERGYSTYDGDKRGGPGGLLQDKVDVPDGRPGVVRGR